MDAKNARVVLSPLTGLDRALAQYREAGDRPVVIAYEQAADLFAKSYYQFLNISPAAAVVLVRPTIGAFALNQLDCPFLLVREEASGACNEGVFHHQRRFGDGATCIPWQLNQDELDQAIEFWLARVLTLEERWSRRGGQSMDDRYDFPKAA